MYTQCVQHLVTFSFRFESNYEFSGTNMCINLASFNQRQNLRKNGMGGLKIRVKSLFYCYSHTNTQYCNRNNLFSF